MTVRNLAWLTGTALMLHQFAIIPAMADIRLPAVFSDKMVLQQGDDVRVWGEAEPGEQLAITLGDSSSAATADESGKWATSIAAPPAGGPYELAISGKEARVVFTDVLVGEVWLCSGQSNMNWPVDQSTELANKVEKDKFLSGLVNSRIRLLTVPQHSVDEPATNFSEAAVWKESSPGEIAEFSGTAYHFARALAESSSLADVPIGLIDASWGGTPGEAWVSREALEAREALAPLLAHWDENTDQRSQHRPGNLFNGMIAPLIPYSIRGTIWYQGEANVGRADQYAVILKTLIEDWRARFGKGDFPFFLVQLAPYRYTDEDPAALPELWDAQQRALTLPNVAIATTCDIGNPADIHPKNKIVVGERLAAIARNLTYGDKSVAWSGPRMERMGRIDGSGQIAIEFSHAEGLHTTSTAPTGFLIAGKDEKFVSATARIEDEHIVVWSNEVPDPVAVRYLWTDTSQGDLFNAAGLPAAPFRTDNYDLQSKGKHF